jgi:hypothetical protein
MWHFIASFDAIPHDRYLTVAVLDSEGFHALEFPCRCNENGCWIDVATGCLISGPRTGASNARSSGAARVCVLLPQKEPQARCALGVPSPNFPIKQLGPNRLSGVGGWGTEGTAQPVGLPARANSLSTRELLAAKRSFGGIVGELEPIPAWHSLCLVTDRRRQKTSRYVAQKTKRKKFHNTSADLYCIATKRTASGLTLDAS